jgi:proteasome accessory factor A
VDAIKMVSRDPSFRWILEREDGRTMRATDIQRIYLRDAQKLLAGGDPDTDWTLREWERLLNDLETDIYLAEDRLDWVAKRRLLETYIEAEGLWWEDEALRSLDLEYHNVDPELGLYYALEEAGQMARFVTDAEVQAAVDQPPHDTRAAVRGELVRRLSPAIERLSWGRVAVRGEGGSRGGEARWVTLNPEWTGGGAGARSTGARGADNGSGWLSRLEAAKTVSEALAIMPERASSGEIHDPDQG